MEKVLRLSVSMWKLCGKVRFVNLLLGISRAAVLLLVGGRAGKGFGRNINPTPLPPLRAFPPLPTICNEYGHTDTQHVSDKSSTFSVTQTYI